jgi:hypothetical protein
LRRPEQNLTGVSTAAENCTFVALENCTLSR